MSRRQISVQVDGFFAVSPKMDCPHLEAMLDRDISHYARIKMKTPCGDCRNIGENWVCLVCQNVKCSRYVNGHGLSHFNDTSHCLALSFSDLSVWCHTCEAYLEHESLSQILRYFRDIKFGQVVAIISRNLEEMKIGEEEVVRHNLLKSKTIKDLADGLRNGDFKKIAVMTGAGISVSAGIPDFRSPESGLYASLADLNLPRPEMIFDINYFRSHPEVFFKVVKKLVGEYTPTPTHYFLRLLELKGHLLKIYTQNMDGLELKAGITKDMVMFAHGNMESSYCSSCALEYDNEMMKQHVTAGTVARCECGGPAKPALVFFGEPLTPGFFTEVAKLEDADLLLVIGTSLKVFPFAGLVSQVRENVPRILINREAAGRTVGMKFEDPNSRDILFLGNSDDIVAQIVIDAGWEEEFTSLIAS